MTGAMEASRGQPRKVVRHVLQAAAAINGEVRPFATILRPEVAMLVAERRRQEGPVVVVSPAGPLTRSELEVVQAIGDPLALSDVLPGGAVGLGRHWRVGPFAAQTLSGYDVITANELDASLESVDRTKARIQIRGRIEGSANGGKGLITCEGSVTFDRQMGWIDRLEVNRAETRSPGPVEMGLDVKSTLTMTRHADQPPATLSDAALAQLHLEITPESQRLLLLAPDGKSTLLHDRQWHSFWDDPKLSVLKRLEGGQVVAQCNLSVGPAAGRGRHQDPTQFRDDVRRALKERFVQFLGAGEVGGDPAGGFRLQSGHPGTRRRPWRRLVLLPRRQSRRGSARRDLYPGRFVRQGIWRSGRRDDRHAPVEPAAADGVPLSPVIPPARDLPSGFAVLRISFQIGGTGRRAGYGLIDPRS